MKKLFLIISAIIIVYSAGAQKIGVKIGLNLATLKSDAAGFDEYKKSLIGINGGLVLEKKVVPYLSLQGEVLFSQKGLYNKPDGGYDKIIINYLEIPLSVKIKVGPTPLYFLAGPYFGYAMNGKHKYDNGVEEKSEELDWDVYKLKRFDFGIHAGLGMKFGPIFIEGRYGLGLTDLNDDADDPNYYKNSVFGISAGVIF
jgi:hypothetical protein